MPSIEFWFLIHFINTNKFFGTSKAVIAELVKHIPRFDKSEAFLSNKKWVEDMISDGKLQDAYSRAKQFDTNGESYSNLWKAFEYLDVFTTKSDMIVITDMDVVGNLLRCGCGSCFLVRREQGRCQIPHSVASVGGNQ